MKKLKVLICYNYNDTLLSCGNMIEEAFRRRDDIEVYRLGELTPDKADVVFNTEAQAERPRGPLTVWWDIEACSYSVVGEFNSDMVLAPYTINKDLYPTDRTYFFPFANDPINFKNNPLIKPTYDLGFVGREDINRERRVEYLNWLEKQSIKMFRVNSIQRGEDLSDKLSSAKIALQVAGDAAGGVMETRFFEVGPITVIAADRIENNREDMDWAAVPDYHYIAFNSKEELLEKVQKYSQDDALRERMYKRALENYMTNHTYDVRVRQLLETIGFLKGQGLDKFHDRRKRWGEYNG